MHIVICKSLVLLANLWAHDPNLMHLRIFLTKEIIQRSTRLINGREIKNQSSGEKYQWTAADHDAEERAELNRYGIPTTAAKKEVATGISAVKKRLAKSADGKPRLLIFSNLKHTLNEIYAYEWLPPREGHNAKEEPRKENDHAMDALRYMVMALDDSRTVLRDFLLRSCED